MTGRRRARLVASSALAALCFGAGCGGGSNDGGNSGDDSLEDGWIELEGGVLGPAVGEDRATSPSGSASAGTAPLPPQPTVGDAGPDTHAATDASIDSSSPPDTTVVDAPIDTGMVCSDTTVDVDGVEGDGCEVTDPMTNRSEASPSKLAVLGACSAYASVSFDLLSDARTHTPSGALGAAPLYWSFFEDTSCALGTKPTLGLFSVGAGAPGSYEVVIYPSGGAPDPKCTGVVHGGESIGPLSCSAPLSGKGYLRIRKLDGAPGTAHVTFKVR